MPDATSLSPAPRDWGDAFAALPLERPPSDAWPRIAARLDARRRPHWPVWLAVAATLLLAVALPWRLHRPDAPASDAPGSAAASPDIVAAADPLENLYAESARLEALLAYARDDRVSSASAVVLAAELDRDLASIDATLRQPGLTHDAQLALWQQRVELLRGAASFEGTRRWLASQGELYDGALARVD